MDSNCWMVYHPLPSGRPVPHTCGPSSCNASVSGDGVLVVENVQAEDAGHYMCTSTIQNSTTSRVCRVDVGGTMTSLSTGEEGGSRSMLLVIDHFPLTSFCWKQGCWRTFRDAAAKSKRASGQKYYSRFAQIPPKNMIAHLHAWKVWWCRSSTLTVTLFRQKWMSKRNSTVESIQGSKFKF